MSAKYHIEESNLSFGKIIAEGSFGEVWQGKWFGTKVAIKKLKYDEAPAIQRYIEREITAWIDLRHPNIVQFLGFSVGQDVCIVTEYIEGGDLRMKLQRRSIHIPWKIRASIAEQTASAMYFLHSKKKSFIEI